MAFVPGTSRPVLEGSPRINVAPRINRIGVLLRKISNSARSLNEWKEFPMQPQRVAFVGAIVMAALTTTRGHADLIPWSYQWNASPIVVNANPLGPNSPVTGGITLIPSAITVTGGLPGVALGNSNIVAVNLTTFSFSPNPAGQPDRFNNSPYNLNVTLTDITSHVSRTLWFHGLFNGTLSDTSAHITTRFTSSTTQSAVLGQNLYTVNLTSFTPPGPPSAGNEGTIGAQVNVQPMEAPEPPTLLLAATGLAGAGAGWLRRRFRPGNANLLIGKNASGQSGDWQ
jgi:hypothetical protein